jgi:hypothetical protein
MKFNKIALAACMAATGFSAQAAMTAPHAALVADAIANNRIVFISGASAVQKGFATLIGNMVTNDTYFGSASTAVTGLGHLAVAGNLTNAAGAWPVGAAVIVIYRTSGGSVFGVDPVARNTAIQALLVDSTCGTTGNGTAATPYNCTTTTATTRVPDAGVSDVAPAFFTNPVNTEGEVAAPSLTTAERGLLSAKPLYAMAFGIPVTNTVPDAAVFNRATVSAIMTGAITNWDKVPGAGTGPIVICRRTPGSGTQAVMNMWAGNYPCSATNAQLPLNRDANANVLDPILDPNTGEPVLDPITGLPTYNTILGAWDPVGRSFKAANSNGNTIVVENDSSGNVRKCLDAAVNGGVVTGVLDRSGQPVSVDFGTGGYKAIGVLSMDSIASSLTAGKWQFRSLDGAGKITGENVATTGPTFTGAGTFPSLAALTTGDWTMQGWVSFNIPTRTTGDKLTFLNQFLAQAQNPTTLTANNDTKWVTAKIASAANTDPQTLKVKYVNNNQCAPLNRQY